jgi:hypothetical protein
VDGEPGINTLAGVARGEGAAKAEEAANGEQGRFLCRAGITAGSAVAGEAMTLARHFLILRPCVGPATASTSTGFFGAEQTDGGSMLDNASPQESA